MVPVARRFWQLRDDDPHIDVVRLAGQLDISPLAATVLARRDLSDSSVVEAFFDASLADLPDPELLPDMQRAAKRLTEAVVAREPILVHGDYDVDGITGTTLLVDFLRQCGADVDFHIPLRLRDGYGLSADAIRCAAERGVKVLVSVDCGISAHAEADLAKQLGIDLLITDHHQPGERLPAAHSLVNPRLAGNRFPDPDLAGVGVAFFLVVALRRCLRAANFFTAVREPDLRLLLDLTALGTIADVVPLRKTNRLLVTKGLELIAVARRPGIAALLEVSGVARVTCGSVGFQLAPRLNAAGRLEDAALGVDLLLCDKSNRAAELARQLDLFNRERREIEQQTLDDALERVAELPDEQRSIVLGGDNWHPGVIGIVASRLVERFHRPTLLIACDGQVGKGSARSVPGFHLYDALSRCSDYLDAFGGHAAAAGFSLATATLDLFAEAFEEVCRSSTELDESMPRIHYDLEADLSQCDMDLALTLERFAPFGMGNSEPLICCRDVQIQQMQTLNGGHLRFTVRQEGFTLPCIAFSMAERVDDFTATVDLLAALQVNRWNGRQNVQLVVKDVRPAHSGEHDA
ncbi:MAG: single-stranded-DNA-specific exonuclease RecJ [Desulfuromonas sp.]|nr:MAG: single-stranded-DNA-specific exonuclease RecJ [Desulfuromonas sp.]